MKRIVAISDTHGLHRDVIIPDGDILVHAGDVTIDGSFKSFADFLTWFKKQHASNKIFCGGNHDEVLDKHFDTVDGMIRDSGCIYLHNKFCEVDGVRVWGSAMSPKFMFWFFMDERKNMWKYWKDIPINLDLLITHGPPYGIMDYVDNDLSPERNVGCKALYRKILEVTPAYSIFGHIHGGYGKKTLGKTTFINASVCNENYQVVNEPIIIDL